MKLEVDARDVKHRIVKVHETLELQRDTSAVTLLLPKWIPGEHAPSGTIDRLAGLTIRAHGFRLPWTRDAADVFAFHVQAPADTTSLDIEFQYLAPGGETSGLVTGTREIVILHWTSLVLYPAGQELSSISVSATAQLPTGFRWASALRSQIGTNSTATVSFEPVPLATLFDAPLFAGLHMRRLELDDSGARPVAMTLFADNAEHLAVTSEQLDRHRALLREADAVFGGRPATHYEFLATLSDAFSIDGLEHRESSEIFLSPGYFDDWQATWDSRYLVPHEYVHAWNGKWRVPRGLHRADLNTDLQTDLLWVYEGQTQYWAKVLSARSGLWSRQEVLDDLAVMAARAKGQPGNTWRSLLDTTREPVMNPRGESNWPSWQRDQDYYDEGALLWLDVDTLLRANTHNTRSLDDFARAFFSGGEVPSESKTYELADIVNALNELAPYDWQQFFAERVNTVGRWDPLGGTLRGGYELTFNDTAGPTCTSDYARRGLRCFSTSIGLIVNDAGDIDSVEWNGPAFQAGLAAGMKLMSVNDMTFTPQGLRRAIVAARTSHSPVRLVVKDHNHLDTVDIDYHGGLRYPHLRRIPGAPALLDAILASRARSRAGESGR